MGRKPFHTPDEKMNVVLSVLRGETTQSDIARRLEMSQTTIAKWQKQFLESGREGLARGENARGEATKREEELEDRVDELTTALGEAYAELRVWRKKGGSTPPVRGARGHPGTLLGPGRALLRHLRHPALHLVRMASRVAFRADGDAPQRPCGRCHRGTRGGPRLHLRRVGSPQDLGDDARGGIARLGKQRRTGTSAP